MTIVGLPMIPTSSGGGGGGGVTDHGALTGNSDDDHTNYVHISTDRTITATHTFNPTVAGTPFTLGANATGQLVSGLNADQLDGLEATAFATASHTHAAADITSGTLGVARGGTGAATAAAAFDALSPMTTSGDVIYGGASGTGTRLAAGSNGEVLTLAAGVPSWAAQAGGGDMSASTYDPASIAEQLVGLVATQTLTNKTINTASNTITVVEADISDLGAYITGITGEPLSDLSDVTITGIASGELLKWNGSAWINNTLAEAGISATGHAHAASDITSGTLGVARGGTGAATASAAFDALSPMTTSGDVIYGGASGTGTRLAAGTNGHVLTLAAGVPSWAAQAGGGDMSASTYDPATIAEQLVGLTATQTLTNKTIDTASNTITVVEADISDLGSYITGITGEPLSDLSDVTITGIASGELLKWNGSAWINNTLAEAGISATGHTHAASDIASGTLALARGGVNADLSGTGGSNQFLKQSSSGANITVAAIVDADVPESSVTQHQAAILTLAENVPIILDPALSADGQYSGITQAGTAGATLAFGDLIYFSVTDSRWELADADAASTAGDVQLGICVLAAASDGSATTVLLWGKVRADTAFPTFTIGAPQYVSTTAGDVTGTQPSAADDVIRRLGFAEDANSLWFMPSPDYITHTG